MRVSRRAEELRALGQDIVDLSAGQPDVPSPRSAVEAVHRALDAGQTKYTAAAGLMDLRKAIAERYRQSFTVPWQAADVVITVGAKAALFELISVLIDDGDEAVLPSPAWVSFEEQIRFAGGTPVLVPMQAENRFRIEAAPLIAAMTEKTRLVLVNSPCNPTGGVISDADLRLLAQACAARGAVLLCDETYECFLYDGANHASGAALARGVPGNGGGGRLVFENLFDDRLAAGLGGRPARDHPQGDRAAEPRHLESDHLRDVRGARGAEVGRSPTSTRCSARFTRRRAFVVDGLRQAARRQDPAAVGRVLRLLRRLGALPPRHAGLDGARRVPARRSQGRPGARPRLRRRRLPRCSFATSMEQLEKGLGRMADALAKIWKTRKASGISGQRAQVRRDRQRVFGGHAERGHRRHRLLAVAVDAGGEQGDELLVGVLRQAGDAGAL